jgi:hypothetical protein
VRLAAALVAVAGAGACGSKQDPPAAPATLVDLSASLDAVRADFDAHAGEARFLALLSPT